MAKIYAFLVAFCLISVGVRSQGLLDELNNEVDLAKSREYVTSTFKGVRIINGQSVEMPAKGELLFIIQHRFGPIKDGIVGFFGLDQASVRFGLEYSMPFTDRWCIGFGRSTYLQTWDFYTKVKLFKQVKRGFPFTIDFFTSMGISTSDFADQDRPNYFSSRLTYTYQLLIAKKFSNRFSLQLTPAVVHKNLVPLKEDQNTAFFLGLGGRFKLSNRVALSAEYFWPVYGQNFAEVNGASILGPLSIGVDWETGGHVFQFHITNAQATFDQGYIAETTRDWLKGDIVFGFNITRTFSFKKGGSKYKMKTE